MASRGRGPQIGPTEAEGWGSARATHSAAAARRFAAGVAGVVPGASPAFRDIRPPGPASAFGLARSGSPAVRCRPSSGPFAAVACCGLPRPSGVLRSSPAAAALWLPCCAMLLRDAAARSWPRFARFITHKKGGNVAALH